MKIISSGQTVADHAAIDRQYLMGRWCLNSFNRERYAKY